MPSLRLARRWRVCLAYARDCRVARYELPRPLLAPPFVCWTVPLTCGSSCVPPLFNVPAPERSTALHPQRGHPMTICPLRALWLACALLLSTIIGICGGVLAWLGGDNPAKAVITGGAAFAAVTTLAILVLSYVAARRRPPMPAQRRRSSRRAGALSMSRRAYMALRKDDDVLSRQNPFITRRCGPDIRRRAAGLSRSRNTEPGTGRRQPNRPSTSPYAAQSPPHDRPTLAGDQVKQRGHVVRARCSACGPDSLQG
jgi:hypothetical protein